MSLSRIGKVIAKRGQTAAKSVKTKAQPTTTTTTQSLKQASIRASEYIGNKTTSLSSGSRKVNASIGAATAGAMYGGFTGAFDGVSDGLYEIATGDPNIDNTIFGRDVGFRGLMAPLPGGHMVTSARQMFEPEPYGQYGANRNRSYQKMPDISGQMVFGQYHSRNGG